MSRFAAPEAAGAGMRQPLSTSGIESLLLCPVHLHSTKFLLEIWRTEGVSLKGTLLVLLSARVGQSLLHIKVRAVLLHLGHFLIIRIMVTLKILATEQNESSGLDFNKFKVAEEGGKTNLDRMRPSLRCFLFCSSLVICLLVVTTLSGQCQEWGNSFWL